MRLIDGRGGEPMNDFINGFVQDMEITVENETWKAVQKMGFKIDKMELVSAITHYRKSGYWWDVGSLSCRCSACGCKSSDTTPYCPNCGAKMDEE